MSLQQQFVFMLSLFSLAIPPAQAQVLLQRHANILKPVKIVAAQQDTSAPLDSLSAIPTNMTDSMCLLAQKPLLTHRFAARQTPDAEGQFDEIRSYPLDVTNFMGMGFGLGSFYPSAGTSDANGAAGLLQYVQVVNKNIAIFEKYSGRLLKGYPKTLSSVWKGFGGLCEFGTASDFIVKYDQLAHRWVIMQSAAGKKNYFDKTRYMQCIAVSLTENAAGQYYRYGFETPYLNEYAKLSVWPNAYYLTSYSFAASGHSVGPRITALDRESMLSGKKEVALLYYQLLAGRSGLLLPADLDGQAQPEFGGGFGFFMGLDSTDALQLFALLPNFVMPDKSELIGPYAISVAEFSLPCQMQSNGACVEQPLVRNKLDPLPDRLMYRFAYRQFPGYGSMLVNHTVQGRGDEAAIRWYEFRISKEGDFSLFQQGTYNPDASHRFMGSMAMDGNGNIALGYTKSSSTVSPSLWLAARMQGDERGKMTLSQPLIEGLGAQVNLDRWASLASMAIDPVDDCTFWFTGQYSAILGNAWSTNISRFRFPGCG